MLKTSSNRKKKTRQSSRSILAIIIGLFMVLVIAAAIYFFVVRSLRESFIIVDAPSIEDVTKYIKPDERNESTLVIFDIDNTLLYPKTLIGSEQWFYSVVKKYEDEGMTTQQAINKLLPQSFELMEYIPMVPIEPGTVPVITNLQKDGIITIALTARSLDLTYRTIDQLASVGIHFNGKGPQECPIVYGDGKPALYMHGVLFCGNHTKEKVLLNWLNQIHYQPKKIIFIDDKMKNVTAVGKALPKHQYNYVGIRYAYLDEHKEKVPQEVIDRELREFAQQYPDARPLTPMPTD